MNDREIIKAFVRHLRENGYPNLKVDCWPDDENQNSPTADAVAGPFAIEHTSVDTIPNQRRDSDWFLKVVRQLEKELSHNLAYRLSIIIPYDGVQKGYDFQRIREALRSWVEGSSLALPDGTHLVSNIPGIPFEFRVTKASDRPSGLFFLRFEPEDRSLPTRLREQLKRKAEKLIRYKDAGKKTILLIESEDLSLMNPRIMLKAIRTGFDNSLPKGVDQVWYADTSIASDLLFSDFTRAVIEKD